MNLYRLVLVLALSGPAWAECPKIEYADVRDWPVAKLEEGYCAAGKEMRKHARLAEIYHASSYNMARAHRLEAGDCAAQQALFGRVIENVHKRQTPACPEPPTR